MAFTGGLLVVRPSWVPDCRDDGGTRCNIFTPHVNTQSFLNEMVVRYTGLLNPTELKLAICIWAAIQDSGEAVEVTIPELALRAGLAQRTVQKYRTRLERKGAIQVLSRSRERSRYALPVGVVVTSVCGNGPGSEMDSSPDDDTVDTGERIAALMSKLIGSADTHVVNEAESLAGGKTELLKCLSVMRDYYLRPTAANFLAIITRLCYGFGPTRRQ